MYTHGVVVAAGNLRMKGSENSQSGYWEHASNICTELPFTAALVVSLNTHQACMLIKSVKYIFRWPQDQRNKRHLHTTTQFVFSIWTKPKVIRRNHVIKPTKFRCLFIGTWLMGLVDVLALLELINSQSPWFGQRQPMLNSYNSIYAVEELRVWLISMIESMPYMCI